MFAHSKKKRRFFYGLVTAVAVGLAFCLVSYFDLLHQTRVQSDDFFFKAADTAPIGATDSPIVIVGIDDLTIEKLGRLASWSRSYYAQLIDNLAAAGARVIVFDVLFAEPAAGDDEFAAAMTKAGNVVLASAVTPDNGAWTVVRPLPTLEENARAIGSAGVIPDEDGIVRRLPLVEQEGSGGMPALSLSAVAAYLRRPQAFDSRDSGHLFLAGRSVPLDHGSDMLINFAGGDFNVPDFPTLSYTDVLDNDFSAGTFNDKIVLVGATAVGLGDTFWTPMGRMVCGVELHAAAINTILNADFLAPAPYWVTDLSILLLALLVGLAVLRFGTIRAVAAACGLAVLYGLSAFFSFDRGMMPDMLYPTIALGAAFVGVSLYRVSLERREKVEIASTFERYVSPAVASRVLEAEDLDKPVLDGEDGIATVLFADARDFTRLSETNTPRELASVLNRYLGVIVATVIRFEGMVNKFEGDNIMAVWNVPAACPDHALMAATAALEAQQALRALRQKNPDLPGLEFGMGINTGPVTAGNMGSAARLEYSVVGDAVNVAARLTDAAPGGRVWAGQLTFEHIAGRMVVRPLGQQMLKGRTGTVQAYEIIGMKSRPPEEAAPTIGSGLWEKGM